MPALFWSLVGFLSGSLPFSAWLGQLFAGVDIRLYGDGNPGSSNAWRAGGWRVGLPALLLDFFKGAVPVWLAHFTFGLEGLSLAVAGVAPVIGHSFSPFLHWRGGKAVAVTFGVWTALAPPNAPFVLGLSMGLFLFLRLGAARAVLLGMFCLAAYLLLARLGPEFLLAWAANFLLLAWNHRRELFRRNRLAGSL
jgi:glycerol-3-phosphate acyltransferase PlsY